MSLKYSQDLLHLQYRFLIFPVWYPEKTKADLQIRYFYFFQVTVIFKTSNGVIFKKNTLFQQFLMDHQVRFRTVHVTKDDLTGLYALAQDIGKETERSEPGSICIISGTLVSLAAQQTE